MKTSVMMKVPNAERVAASDEELTVALSDGRTVLVPLIWFPRLVHTSARERANWRLVGKGQGIHWEDLDEDISVAGILAGKPSGESQESLARWIAERLPERGR